MATGSYLSVITLNVNGLNTPTKRQRLAEWIQKQDPIYIVYKRSTSKQGTHTDWKWRAGKKIYHANRDHKKAGVSILISDKIDFKCLFISYQTNSNLLEDRSGSSCIILSFVQCLKLKLLHKECLSEWTLLGEGVVVIQSLSCVWLFASWWTATYQVSLFFTMSLSLLRFMSIELVMHPTI